MGSLGIVTKLFQRDKIRRGRPPHGNAPPNTSRPRRPDAMAKKFQTQFSALAVYLAFFVFSSPTYFQSPLNLTNTSSTFWSVQKHLPCFYINSDFLLPSLGITMGKSESLAHRRCQDGKLIWRISNPHQSEALGPTTRSGRPPGTARNGRSCRASTARHVHGSSAVCQRFQNHHLPSPINLGLRW
jgi:hypothetical protein